MRNNDEIELFLTITTKDKTIQVRVGTTAQAGTRKMTARTGKKILATYTARKYHYLSS